jgi:hypothetical protein
MRRPGIPPARHDDYYLYAYELVTLIDGWGVTSAQGFCTTARTLVTK